MPDNRNNNGQKRDYDYERERRRRAMIRRQKRRRKRRIQRAILIGAMLLILILLILLMRGCVRKVTGKSSESKSAQALEIEESTKKVEAADAVITTAGDIIMHKPFLESSNYFDGQKYEYNDIFRYVKDIYESADFTVCTTEYAMTGGNYSGYPCFCSPDAIADALKDNGVDMCNLANNHIYDGSDEGLQRTMEVLDQKGILYDGTRKTEEDKKYVIQDINGIKVGFFNYVFETEKVNGQKTINGIAVTDKSSDLICSFQEADPESLYTEVDEILAEMKKEGVEYTIAYMHWGEEYQTTENSNQDKIAQGLCDRGIDAIVASHPHVIQPVDLLTSEDGKHQTVCFYAIGNQLSNQRTEYMDGLTNGYSEDGMIVTLTIHRDEKGKISLTGCDVIPTWVYHSSATDDLYYILPLDKPDELQAETGLTDLGTDVKDSLGRTEGIVGKGVEKVQEALPIAAK